MPCRNAITRYLFLILLCFLCVEELHCQTQDQEDFEEISVVLYIKQIGSTEIPGYIRGETLFLPVVDVFNFLKIKSIPTPGYDSVTGFFIDERSKYILDRVHDKIIYRGNTFNLKPGDLVRTETNLYLKSDYFGEIFGLECRFVFNSLSVQILPKMELPVIREMRQAQMRTNLGRLKGNLKPDTAYKLNYPLFLFGVADWAISTTQRSNNSPEARLNLSLGGILAGGATTLNLNYTSNQPITHQQQFYLWHFANNDFKAVKQVMLGKIPVQSSIPVRSALIGFLLTNTPTTFQRSFGTYTLTDYTQPGWIVELYVNYVLVDYTVADASGYFSFEVPLVYGNSFVKLKFYGPWGEEHTREQTIRVPFNFLPPGRLEYTINGGVMENAEKGKYTRLNMNLGATRWLTLGGGLEYHSDIPENQLMPYGTASMRLFSSLLLSGEYIYGVRFKGLASYRLPRDIMIELYYTKLRSGQQAFGVNYLENRKLILTFPLGKRFLSTMVHLTADHVILPTTSYLTSELVISSLIAGISTNLTTHSLFMEARNPYIFCDLSLGVRLPAQIIVTPQAQFLLTEQKMMSAKVEFEKRFLRNGTFSFLVERNFITRINSLQVGLRYDFRALQANVNTRITNEGSTFMQFARGSMVNEGRHGGVKFSRISSVGKGGLLVIPFLDMNANGKQDEGEVRVQGLMFKVSGGRVDRNTKDTLFRVYDLEPYTTYYLELERQGFENVSWQITKPVISAAVNPNQYKRIEVPITVMGEISGHVYVDMAAGQQGLGRITVSICREDSTVITRLMSEIDGFYNFLGLPPGKYLVMLDPDQLGKIGLFTTRTTLPFRINESVEGEQVTELDFHLTRENNAPGRNNE